MIDVFYSTDDFRFNDFPYNIKKARHLPKCQAFYSNKLRAYLTIIIIVDTLLVPERNTTL